MNFPARYIVLMIGQALALAPPAVGQTASGTPAAFEVISVKPSPPSGSAPLNNKPGTRGFLANPTVFGVRNATLKSLIRWAYDLDDYQISGGPGWTETERFDVDAKPEKPSTQDEMRLMLRTALGDRFQLKPRFETKDMLLNLLTVADGGPKFGANFHLIDDSQPAPNSKPVVDQLHSRVTLQNFATILRLNLTHDLTGHAPIDLRDIPPVLDKTGLTGVYDITLNTRDQGDWPEVLKQQLGLRLERRKVPTETLVIESCAKPSPN